MLQNIGRITSIRLSVNNNNDKRLFTWNYQVNIIKYGKNPICRLHEQLAEISV